MFKSLLFRMSAPHRNMMAFLFKVLGGGEGWKVGNTVNHFFSGFADFQKRAKKGSLSRRFSWDRFSVPVLYMVETGAKLQWYEVLLLLPFPPIPT